MGYWIGYCDESIWEPNLTVGLIFMNEIKVMEKILRVQSGFIEEAADLFEIDKGDLNIFLTKFGEFYSISCSYVLKQQLLPTLSILYEILRRIDHENAEKMIISEDVRYSAERFSEHMAM